MKFKNWTTDTPTLSLALKLCEEAAEVGKAVNYNFSAGNITFDQWTPIQRRMLLEELDHVDYLSKTIRMKLENFS